MLTQKLIFCFVLYKFSNMSQEEFKFDSVVHLIFYQNFSLLKKKLEIT